MHSTQHVYVGMSGGVDSSLTAAFLVEAGYKVTGVYMKNWSQDLPGFYCPWREDYEDAMRVAVDLGIEFKLYDFEKEYRKTVVEYMIHSYKSGVTPNPDIMCNQEIKFALFLQSALHDGADYIATGHYAQTHDGALFKGTDNNKDQSYFLYRVTSQALERTFFPLGNMTKTEVRDAASVRKLHTAHKKDSQGICFIGSVGIKDFLQAYVETRPGSIIDYDTMQIVGQHEGALFYTIGQRHGLGVGGGLPYYVVDKNMSENVVYVSRDIGNELLWSREVSIVSEHWITRTPQENTSYHVRLRHRGPLIPCMVKRGVIYLEHPVRAVAPGQSAVIYDDNEVLGGGVINQKR